MALGRGKPLRRGSRERRPPPSPPAVVIKKAGQSSKIPVVNKRSSLANNASSEDSATESGSDSQESSSSEQSFSKRRAASASSDDVPLSCSVPDRMGKTRRKAAADDDVVMEVADVGEAPASGARETRKTEKRKKKPKVNLKAPEPPAKPKSLSQVAADRSESPVASTSQSVEIPPDYHRVDLNTYAFQGEFGWADIRFPISYDESTVLPRFAYIREYTVESACEYMRVHRRDHPDFLRRPGCSDADFAHQGFLLMEPGSSLFPEGKSIAAVLLRFNGFKIAHQSILYRLPAIKPPPPFPEDPSHPFFYDPDDPEPPEPSTDTKPFPPFEDKACYTLAERSAKKAEWRNLVTAHNASEAERVRLAVDVYDTKHAEWASRASVRIEKARARDQYEIEAISTYNRKRQETFDEFSSALHTAGAYLVFLITDDLRRSRLADIKDTSTTAESGPSWRPKQGRAPLELHPAIESLSETDLPKSVLDEVLGPNGFKEDLSKYDLQTLVTILRVMKIQGVMIGEARSQTYISMYMGSENEYDPDTWHKDNSPFDPNAGTGHRVRGWSVDAESSGYIEGFVQDELIPAVIARRMCFTRGMGCIECLFGMIPCIRVMHGDSPVAGSCIHCRAKKNKCIMTPGPYCFAITDRILALFNEHWVLFVISSLLFRWIQATRGMDAAALARRSFYDLIAQGPSSVPSGEPIPALPTGLAEAFKPVVGGLGIGDEDVVEEATETAADVKGKGKRSSRRRSSRKFGQASPPPRDVRARHRRCSGPRYGRRRLWWGALWCQLRPAEPPPSDFGLPNDSGIFSPRKYDAFDRADVSSWFPHPYPGAARTPSADPSFSSLSGCPGYLRRRSSCGARIFLAWFGTSSSILCSRRRRVVQR
ncbi:hypothetical protein DFH06DRAFT_1342975 [Mycena polygramma]|nr:hypothetical protein DFH06DRAFT_1342975 [Mycena polygramma]